MPIVFKTHRDIRRLLRLPGHEFKTGQACRLPPEIQVHIALLALAEAITSMERVCLVNIFRRVCRTWNHLIIHSPSAWTTMIVHSGSEALRTLADTLSRSLSLPFDLIIRFDTFNDLFVRSNATSRILTFAHMWTREEVLAQLGSQLRNVAKHSDRLRSLTSIGTPGDHVFSDRKIHGEGLEAEMAIFVGCCPGLEAIHFRTSDPHVREQAWGFYLDENMVNRETLRTLRIPGSQFRIHRCASALTNITRLEFTGTVWENKADLQGLLVRVAPRLEKLKLAGTTRFPSNSPIVHMPNLLSLYLGLSTRCSRINLKMLHDAGLTRISAPSLKTLILEESEDIVLDEPDANIVYRDSSLDFTFPKLRALSISTLDRAKGNRAIHEPVISDEVSQMMIKASPHLERLSLALHHDRDLDLLSHMSKYSVSGLVIWPFLQTLVLVGCKFFKDSDIKPLITFLEERRDKGLALAFLKIGGTTPKGPTAALIRLCTAMGINLLPYVQGDDLGLVKDAEW
jgi:hypothetical protein